MSLAQHVSVTESFDLEGAAHRVDEEEPLLPVEGRTGWKRGSYDTFAPTELITFTEEPEPHIAAYNVSGAKRAVQVGTGILACWLASGIVFGFAALKPVLVNEGVFAEQCPRGWDPVPEGGGDFYIPCPEQDLRLNFFFIVGSITTNASSLVAGTVLDRFGRRVCWLLSTVFIAVGLILMGNAFAITEFDGYIAGNLFLGLGGTFLFVPTFQLSNAFPRYAGLVVALITGAFDASAAVFLFYQLAYKASGRKFTPTQFFFWYLIVPILIFAAELAYMPPSAYQNTPEIEQKLKKALDPTRDVHDSDDEIVDDRTVPKVREQRSRHREEKLHRIETVAGDEGEREERMKRIEERQEVSGIWGMLHGLPAHRQMLTKWFIFILLLTVLQMVRMNYFIATIRSQYRYMLASEVDAELVNRFFDIALPLGGVVSTPFIGILLNNMSMAAVFLVCTVLIVVIGVLNCVPYLWAGYATVLAFVVFRPLYYSVVSDYTTKVFGFVTFGRIYGMLICLSGLMNFAQPGLDALTEGHLRGNPTPINIVMAVLGTILTISLSVHIAIAGWNCQELKYEEDQDEGNRLVTSETVEVGD